MLSPNVSVVSTTGTTEGDTVTLQCEDGLSLVISCNRSGVWNPDPAELVCTSPQGELTKVFKCVLELLLAILCQQGIIIMHITIFIAKVRLEQRILISIQWLASYHISA